jgi:hypothetical protein
VARLQRALRLQESGLPWTRVATDAGYPDQAHLTHEWRTMVSCTPNGFRAIRSSSDPAAAVDRIPGQVTSAIVARRSHMTSPAGGDLRLSNPDSLDPTDSNCTEHWARCGGIDPA